MNSIVFVLMVWTHGGYVVPTTEFTSMKKCNTALHEMELAVGKAAAFATGVKGQCVRIEK